MAPRASRPRSFFCPIRCSCRTNRIRYCGPSARGCRCGVRGAILPCRFTPPKNARCGRASCRSTAAFCMSSGAEPPPLSPLAARGRDRFKRGLLVHRLLQSLPELPIEEREVAARRFLALPTHRLPVDEQADIRRDTLAVLDHPEFAALFGPG